ncbi:hypothetical protein OB69_08775 [Roseivirga seohaensis subsp. aquiponti]|uniref:RES domain-containing protein n=1 Tax=Roseivirga seohaensis subsp. aquiponti TaxID=1566026 RepID=A0A0L8AL00_9BACT|nr:RES family NAD+ phosphorylase [Roseivirga seohaensis]KOF02926.1 hypothetical protein OB69_08775 [Roseivirga seohaensis subsp. aquiponti]
MNVWRVSYISSLGGSDVPGRWNEKGIKVLYTSANPSLCSWEYFAHKVGEKDWPINLKLLELSIPNEHPDIVKLPINKLTEGWNGLAYKRNVQKTARQELLHKNRLGIWVPSVVIPEDYNLILNPNYAGFESLIKRKSIFPFEYDQRFKVIFE